MKKRILYLVGGMILLFGACKPIENRQEAGAVVPATDFVYTITNDATNDYILYLENKTPEVMFSWDYAWGVSRKQHDTVKMLVPGTYTVNITATTAGGLVTTSKVVTVTKSDPTAFQEPEWTLLQTLLLENRGYGMIPSRHHGATEVSGVVQLPAGGQSARLTLTAEA